MTASACPQCGHPRQGVTRFCTNCAFDYWKAAQGAEQPAAAPTASAGTRAPTIVGAIVLLAVVLGGAYAVLAGSREEPQLAGADGDAASDEAEADAPTPEPTLRPTPDPAIAACDDDGGRWSFSEDECTFPTPEPSPTPTLPPLTFDEQVALAINVSYDDLFRNSAHYVGELVYFRGEVIQVLGEPGGFEMRISVTQGEYGFWDDPVYVFYSGNDRFLVEDIVDFVGVSADLITYESVLGGEITIPSVFVASDGMRLVD